MGGEGVLTKDKDEMDLNSLACIPEVNFEGKNFCHQ